MKQPLLHNADTEGGAGGGPASGSVQTPARKTVRTTNWSKCVIMLLLVAVIGLAIALGISMNSSSNNSCPVAYNGPVLTSQFKSSLLAKMNTSTDPCDDFFEYACGTWVSQQLTLFNATGSRENVSAMATLSFDNITAVVSEEQLSTLADRFPFISDFYDSCQNTAAIDAQGWQVALENTLAEINGVSDVNSFLKVLGTLQTSGLATTAFLSISVQPDFQFADYQRMYVAAGMPFANFISTDAYNDLSPLLIQIFYLIQVNDPTLAVEGVWQLEQQILNVLNANPQPSYYYPEEQIAATQRFTLAAFQSAYGWDLSQFFSTYASAVAVNEIDVITPEYFGDLYSVINGASLTNLQNYLKFHALIGNLQYLPAAFRQLADEIDALPSGPYDALTFDLIQSRHPYNYIEHVLMPKLFPPSTPAHPFSSVKQLKALRANDSQRQSFCLNVLINSFDDLLSHEWVLAYYSPDKRQLAKQLVSVIYQGIGDIINATTWLDAPTKQQALLKWSLIQQNVGFNGAWLEYESVAFTGVLFTDRLSLLRYTTAVSVSQYDQAVDRSVMPTRDYMIQNAFYQPSLNSINLPAGLQYPPFLDPTVPLMLNLATYGMVIGHEISHGFDNTGRQYNGTGAFINWWSNSSLAEFENRTKCLIDQYNQYPIYNKYEDGARTLGENIADGGGSHVSYVQYKKYAQVGQQLMDNMSNDQLFFLWYAQSWCAAYTPQAAYKRLATDVHSNAKYRVIGPLSNNIGFAQAYQCSPQSRMGRSLTKSVCQVW